MSDFLLVSQQKDKKVSRRGRSKSQQLHPRFEKINNIAAKSNAGLILLLIKIFAILASNNRFVNFSKSSEFVLKFNL